ncbi:MAG: M48 family metallopeptidase [Bryobacteraceae bacterium]
MTPNQQGQWDAFYYDGRSADREPVRVTFSTSSLTIERRNGLLLHWQYSELRRGDASFEGGPLRLERGKPAREVLLVPDARVGAYLKSIAPYGGLGATRGGHTAGKVLAALLAATVFAVYALFQWVLPAAGDYAASRIPPSWESKLGETVVRQLTVLASVCQDPARRKPVEDVVARIAKQYPGNPYRFRVYLVDSEMVNAIAAPGGHIVVYRGLIEKTRSADELAAVLAHEVAHVTGRHGTKAMMRSVTLWTILSLLVGDTSGAIVSLAGALEELRFSRAQEEQADAEARRVFEQAHLDPAAMVRIFKMLEETSPSMPGESYLSTHPRMADRVATIEQWSAEQRYTPSPALPGTPWPPLVRGCAGAGN